MNRLLVISDLDGTLLGDDAALAALMRWVATLDCRVQWAYSSGRFIPSMVESLRGTSLPEPAALIGGVGTQMMLHHRDDVANWPCANGWCAASVVAALDGVPGLTPQPPQFQSPYKISYFLHHASKSQLNDVNGRLQTANVHANVVYSSSRDLDVLPAGVNKGTAAVYLAKSLRYARQSVVVCGDSANDLSMFQHGFRGVIVGNAHDDLRDAALAPVYHARQTHAAGVQEGIAHWLQVPREHLGVGPADAD